MLELFADARKTRLKAGFPSPPHRHGSNYTIWQKQAICCTKTALITLNVLILRNRLGKPIFTILRATRGDEMDQEPTIGDVIGTRVVDGVPQSNRVLLVDPTLWPLTLARIEHPEEWLVIDFGDRVVAIGPTYGPPLDLARDRLGASRFRE